MKILKMVSLVVLAIVFTFSLVQIIRAATTTVALNTADAFAVLAGTTITNTGSSVITGDLGLSPGTEVTGFPPGTVSGVQHITDATALQAQTDLITAYDDAAGRTPVTTVPTELGGTTLTSGVYDSADGTFGITGTLTLDAEGDANAVFIFKTASTLITVNDSVVSLINGAQACNVFWQVGSSATLGTNSTFKGNILALTAATLTTGANVEGRVLARNAAVTLDTNIITKATCAVAPQLTVTKSVTNDNGGTKTASSFPLFIDGSSVTTAIASTTSVGLHTVSETADAGYTSVIGGDCATDGTITLAIGDVKLCTITNDDIAAPPSGGAQWTPTVIVPPLIDVIKVPSPLALPAGPGPVVYNYTLRNIGTVPVTNITIFDDSCSSTIFISGDTNADTRLDMDETWIYKCSATLFKTHTNNVVATGWANGISVTDVANATVVVGLPVVPPLIHVTKVPNPLALSAGGGAVTYTYTVTNPGTAPLSNVSITDDKCTGLLGRVTGHPGDINKNNLLESNEKWSFTCKTELTKTTTNVGTAVGSANGLTATDFAIVTVVVSDVAVSSAVPKLPTTGFPPAEKNILWTIIIFSGALILISISLVLVLKKRVI